MRRLIESIEIEKLNHDIVDCCKEVSPMTELYLVTIFDRQIFETDQIIIEQIDDDTPYHVRVDIDVWHEDWQLSG